MAGWLDGWVAGWLGGQGEGGGVNDLFTCFREGPSEEGGSMEVTEQYPE